MDSTNFARNKENRLKELIKDPSRAIALQSAIPSSATCAILKMMRRILGSLNIEDQLELSKEMKDLIDNIQQNNYFLYLVLMGRFDLIFEVFQKEGFLKELEEIKELQKKKNDKKFAQNLELFQKKMGSDSYIKKEETYDNPLFNTKMVENHLNVYQYFLLSYREETRNFHTRQIQTYERDYDTRVDLMQRAINVVEQNDMIPQATANNLSVLHQNYQNARNSIEQIQVADRNGIIDDKKLEEKHLTWANLRFKYSKLFKEILQPYEIYPEIAKILKEAEENDKKIQFSLMKNEKEYHEKISQIAPQLEASAALVKQDLSRGIEEVKKELKSINTNNLSEKEQKELQSFISHLEENQKLISQVKNPLEIHTATNQVIENLKNFEKTHSMSFLKVGKIQTFEKFKSLLTKINQGVNPKILQNEEKLENHSIFAPKNPEPQNSINIISSEEVRNNIEKTKSFHQEIKEVCENKPKAKTNEFNSIIIELETIIHSLKKSNSFKEEIDSSLDLCTQLKKDFSQSNVLSLMETLEVLSENNEEIYNLLNKIEEFNDELNPDHNLRI